MFGLFSDDKDKCECCKKSLEGLRIETSSGRKFCSKRCAIDWLKKVTGAS